MKRLSFLLLLAALSVPVLGAEKSVRTPRRERLETILKEDAATPPADIWEAVRSACKPNIRATRKGEAHYSDRVLNGALLFEAARLNADATMAWALKEHNADPNDMQWDNYGAGPFSRCSPLHIAATYASVEAAKVLLAANANPNVVDSNGNTPLMRAAASGAEQSAELVRLLLAHGANPALRNHEGKTAADMVPLQEETVFGMLCRCGVLPQDETRFRQWLQGEYKAASPDAHELQLALAVHADDLVGAESLLKMGVSPCFTMPHDVTAPPLFVAINHGNADMVRLLMRYGAEFPEYASPDYFPWMYAVVLSRNPDILDLLPYYEPKEGVAESPLIVALRGRCGVEMAAALLERGANIEARSLNSSFDYGAYTIVRTVAPDVSTDRLLESYLPAWSLYDVAAELPDFLKTPGVFAWDKRGMCSPCTPLEFFRMDKNESAVNALLAAGADATPVCSMCDAQTGKSLFGTAPAVADVQVLAKQALQALENNDTAYFVSMAKEDLNRAFYPVTCAACKFDPGPGPGRYYMGTALEHAAAAGKTDILRVLLARGADLEHADVFGKTAIVKAAANGHVDCVRLLLNAGARQHGRALQMAALCGQHAVVDYLLQRGVRHGLAPEYALMSDSPHPGLLAHRRPDADVALGLAVKLCHAPAVKLLIAKGANVNRPNFYPLHDSIDLDVLQALVDAGADVTRKNKDGLTPLEYHRNHKTHAAVNYLESLCK